MSKLRTFFEIAFVVLVVVGVVFLNTQEPKAEAQRVGAISFTFQPSLIPSANSTYTLGTTSKTWLNLFVDQICLAGNCQTSWPAGGGSSFSTTSAQFFLSVNQGPAFSTTSANYWKTQTIFTGASSTLLSDNNTFSGKDIFGGVGGFYPGAAGAGVAGIGFNSVPDGSYVAGVTGYGALMQLSPSTGAFTMFAESNAVAGAAHSHIQSLSWDATGLVTLPQGFIAQASSTVNGDFASKGYLNVFGSTAGTSTFYGNVEIKGRLRDDSVLSALILDDAAGLAGAYGGSSCGSNTFASSINGAGALSCTNVPNAALANSTIVVNGTTLTLGDTSDIISAFSTTSAQWFLSLNQGPAFSTSSANAFINASTTLVRTNIITLPTLSLPYTQVTGTPAIPGYPFNTAGSFNATTTLTTFFGGIIVQASSTIQNLWTYNSTSTNATSTNMSMTNASTTNLFVSGLQGKILTTDMTGKVVATTTIGNNFLNTSGVTAGSYTNSNITVNDRGIVTSASNGAAGAGSYPFVATPYNSTSTIVTFTGGLVTNASTTIGNPTATTTLLGNIMIGNVANSGMVLGSTTMLQVSGSYNSFGQMLLWNTSAGSNASTDIVFNNNLSTNSAWYGEMGINSSNYQQAAFSGERPNDFFITSSDGGIDISLASTTASDATSSIDFYTRGPVAANLTMRLTNSGKILMGTSSPAWGMLTVASSTGPQIALSDGLGNNFWTMRTISNAFYLATSTRSATSTIAAFSIGPTGVFNFYGAGLAQASGGTGATSVSPAFTVVSNVFSIVRPFSVTFQATTTTGTMTGTTTIPIIQVTQASTIIGYRCKIYPTTGLLFLNFVIGNGTASTSVQYASSTSNYITTNLALAAGDSVSAEVGTSTAATGFKFTNCTVDVRT